MATPMECLVCFVEYSLQDEHLPMCLGCGHTLCSGCLENLRSKTCPACRTEFKHPPTPNYSLRDMIAVSVAATPLPTIRSEEAAEAHISAITAHIAAKQKLVEDCGTAADGTQEEAHRTKNESDRKHKLAAEKQEHATIAKKEAESREAKTAELVILLAAAQLAEATAKQLAADKQREAHDSQTEAAEAQERTDLAHKKAQDAHNEAALAHNAFDHLSTSLRPLKRSLEYVESDTEGSLAGPSSGSSSSRKNKRASGAAQQVVFVTTDDLGAVLDMMRQDCRRETSTYDFQARKMKFDGQGSPTIMTDGVTWRNGSIMLQPTQSLVILARKVSLQKMCVSGGADGVKLQSDSSLHMSACNIHDVIIGVRMEGSSSLTASDLKILDCRGNILRIKGTSIANIADAELSSGSESNFSISITDQSSLVGTRMRITGIKGYVIMATGQSSVALTSCTLTATPARLIGALEDCVVRLCSCASNCMVVKSSTATVQSESRNTTNWFNKIWTVKAATALRCGLFLNM